MLWLPPPLSVCVCATPVPKDVGVGRRGPRRGLRMIADALGYVQVRTCKADKVTPIEDEGTTNSIHLGKDDWSERLVCVCASVCGVRLPWIACDW